MNRIIKFRAHDKKINTFSYFSFEDIYQHIDSLGMFTHRQEDLDQSTGLVDKNGKDIYEGDIRIGKYYSQSREVTAVEVMTWDNENAQFYWKRVKGSIPDFIEVIVSGNIHQNPELLT